MTSKEALKELEIATNWSSDEDIDKDLYNLWGNVACRTIKKDLDRLEELEKAFDTLSKDYEMEHTLRIRLEDANYELVRKNQENEKKLEAIKDLERELGIDVITLFKALKNGFYTKSNNGIKFWKEDDKHFVYVRDLKYDIEICCEECENAIGAVPTMFLERSTKDYGKTWALTKEELENE